MNAISIIELKVKNAENLVLYYNKRMRLDKDDKYLELIATAQEQLIIYDNLLREIKEVESE